MAIDPEQLELARVYAAGLLDACEASETADDIQGDLDSLAALVGGDRDFADFIASPVIGSRAKIESLLRVLTGRVNELTLRFLRVLADHGRLDLLAALGEGCRAERDDRMGRVHVELTTAAPLDAAARGALSARLTAALGGPAILHERVDPGVVGGVTIRVGDELFDGSVRRRLELLREQIIAKGSHEIQSGRNLVAD